MTRKNKARYGVSRTYALNPAVKALRNALSISLALVVVAPYTQAGSCLEDPSNTISCEGLFNSTINIGPGDVTNPLDLTTIILDETTVIDTTDNYGVFASVTGDLSFDSDADITVHNSSTAAGILGFSNNGDASITNNGSISATSDNSVAFGMVSVSFATAGNGSASATNNGAINVASFSNNDAFGIFVQAMNNEVSVTTGVGSSIVAETIYGDAEGIHIQPSSKNIMVDSAGTLTVNSEFGDANGINATTYNGSVDIANSGDINADTDYGSATGIIGSSNYGEVSVTNSGDLTVTAYDDAIGIDARGFSDVVVSNTGNITTHSTSGEFSVGIYVTNQIGEVLVGNSGDIDATNINGFIAAGILASSFSGYVSVTNTGAIHASNNFYSAGIVASSTRSDVNVINSGDIDATAYGHAVGIHATSIFANSNINNDADINVNSTNFFAEGLSASASYLGDATVTNSGDITTNAYYGAVGISAIAQYYVDVTNSGDITVASQHANMHYANAQYSNTTSGIFAASYDGAVYITNSGDLHISSLGDSEYGSRSSVGIAAYAYNSSMFVENTGDITATSAYSDATGISANAFLNVNVTNNGAITATGINATGIFANAGSYTYSEYGGGFTYLGDVMVTTGSASHIVANGEDAAYGMYLTSTHGLVVVNDGSIKANSESGIAVGIKTQSQTGTLITNSGSIEAVGSDAWAIMSDAGIGAIEITNTASGTIKGAISTGSGNDRLVNLGKWYVGNDNTATFGVGDDMIINDVAGKIFMDGSSIDMGAVGGFGINSFVNNGKLYANGSVNTIDMGAPGSVFTNNGSSIHMEDGSANDSLTIIGDFAGNGHVVVDANGTTMTADHLNIVGNVVAGTANVVDVNVVNGLSIADILDGEVINIVNVTGTSTAANFTTGAITFAQDELYTVQGGIVKNGGNFGLGFAITGLSATGVLASDISPGVQNLWNQGTGTLFQREGSHHPDEGETPDYNAGVWARYYGASGSVSPDARHDNFGAGGSNNFDQDINGWEVGVSYAFNNQWAIGLLGGSSDSTLNPDIGGRAKIEGDTFGGYVTWTPGNGFYADLSYRAMSFDGNGQAGQTAFGFKGDADGYNLELGYGFKFSKGLIVEPQFQFSSVNVDMDRIDYHGADYSLTDGDSSLLRLGAAARQSFDTSSGSWTPYGAVSYLDELDGNNNYDIGGLGGNVDTSGGSVLLEAGVSGVYKGFGYSAGMNWRDGSAYDSVFGGQVSVRYDW